MRSGSGWATVVAFVIGVPSATGCGTEADPALDSATTQDAVEAWANLESRLLDTDPLRVRFDVESTGLIASNLRGSVSMSGDSVDLTAAGEFAGQPQSLRLLADPDVIHVGPPEDPIAADGAPGLRESIVIGLTRMGILHNLARLTANATPDHMRGGVRQWVRVDSLAWGPEETLDGRPARSLDFRIIVDGADAGSARLYLDQETGLPLQRLQTVRFPQGDMEVTETYVFE